MWSIKSEWFLLLRTVATPHEVAMHADKFLAVTETQVHTYPTIYLVIRGVPSRVLIIFKKSLMHAWIKIMK
ncbi:hypothetical protein DVH24_042176 [Malus domestica]|uniref:Uncharacterized protein n=1 Tax=Malus domestica TaxID=3750 RepID=A0A498J0F0_MALDO|nr:hypothetical protein DVH24_042176 [Malus domestica]